MLEICSYAGYIVLDNEVEKCVGGRESVCGWELFAFAFRAFSAIFIPVYDAHQVAADSIAQHDGDI